jgi:pilus assembly protein CpaB
VTRRVIAALAALVLAAVGGILVLAYANRADQRAVGDQETVEVLVASEPLSSGTPAESLDELVETALVPRAVVTDSTLTDLEDVEGLILSVDIAAGEQLYESRFLGEDELRARGETTLPEGTEELHQVTIPLAKARALGGNVAPGDTVGVFMSYDATESGGYVLNEDGTIERGQAEGEAEDSGDTSINMTHLTLHKVPVVRVEGAYVPPPPRAQDEEGTEAQAAEDTVYVTLALDAPDAERLVFGMEWGQLWLSYEPEEADEEGTEVVVVVIPNEARDVFQ